MRGPDGLICPRSSKPPTQTGVDGSRSRQHWRRRTWSLRQDQLPHSHEGYEAPPQHRLEDPTTHAGPVYVIFSQCLLAMSMSQALP